MLVHERFGVDKIPYTFLLNGLPIILFGPRLANLVPNKSRATFFVCSQLLLALNVAALVFSTSSLHVFLYIFIAATITSVSNPCQQSLISDYIVPAEMATSLRKIGALDACSLIFAPALGGFIATKVGFNALFVIDSLTFVAAAALLSRLPSIHTNTERDVKPISEDQLRSKKSFALVPTYYFRNPSQAKSLVLVWVLVVSLVALLNGVEFSIFDKQGLDKQAVGWALTLWGAGSSLPFFIGQKIQCKNSFLAIALALAFTLFAFGPGVYAVYVASIIAGFLFIVLMSNVRSDLQNGLGTGKQNLMGWAVINQRTRIVSVSIYLVCALWLKHFNPTLLYTSLIIVPLMIYAILESLRVQTSQT